MKLLTSLVAKNLLSRLVRALMAIVKWIQFGIYGTVIKSFSNDYIFVKFDYFSFSKLLTACLFDWHSSFDLLVDRF